MAWSDPYAIPLGDTVMCVKTHAWLASFFKPGEFRMTLTRILFENKKLTAVFFPESWDTGRLDTKHDWFITLSIITPAMLEYKTNWHHFQES